MRKPGCNHLYNHEEQLFMQLEPWLWFFGGEEYRCLKMRKVDVSTSTTTKSSERSRWKRSVTSWPTSTNSFDGSKRLNTVPAQQCSPCHQTGPYARMQPLLLCLLLIAGVGESVSAQRQQVGEQAFLGCRPLHAMDILWIMTETPQATFMNYT